MPNPNELERMAQERSQQYQELQESRNNISHHRWCKELREVRKTLSSRRLCKSDKEALLGRIRELEKLTGFPSENYNG